MVYSPPDAASIRQFDTHRLISAAHSQSPGGWLDLIANDGGYIAGIDEMESATNDRLLAKNGMALDIGMDELVTGIPNHEIINAAFTHCPPEGNRFSGANRGAWYAAFDIETSHAEISWHMSRNLEEIDLMEESVTYDDYLADFSGDFHDIRDNPAYEGCLDPDSYSQSQKLAERLLADAALGIVYPSVRHTDGTCLACFRPALVNNVRKAARYRFTWSGSTVPEIEKEEDYT